MSPRSRRRVRRPLSLASSSASAPGQMASSQAPKISQSASTSWSGVVVNESRISFARFECEIVFQLPHQRRFLSTNALDKLTGFRLGTAQSVADDGAAGDGRFVSFLCELREDGASQVPALPLPQILDGEVG